MTEVRRGQLVLPFGVGALVEVGNDSYVCADLSRWTASETAPIDDCDLSRIIRRVVRTPVQSAPFVRFPRWLFCPRCRHMHRLTPGKEQELLARGYQTPRCPHCRKSELTPVGFVQACPNGHLDEVDWFRWAHLNVQVADRGQCAPGTAKLKFITTGARGGDWETLWIECGTCKARRNLEGLTTRPLPWRCRARQPWMSQDGPPCDAKPGAHRRGDSNLYFPVVLSAIDLAQATAERSGGVREKVRNELEAGRWAPYRSIFEQMGAANVAATIEVQLSDLAMELNVPLEEVTEAFIAELENSASDGDGEAAAPAAEQPAILADEWPVLARASAITLPNLIIVPRNPPASWPKSLRAAIKRISLIPRLREVRALLGYRRVDEVDGRLVPLSAPGRHDWAPGVEVWGEGIFIQFDEAFVTGWEQGPGMELNGRLRRLAERHAHLGKGGPPPTSRLVALHTLSHALLRRLAFDAGYSSTALRERVYAGSNMAGILIYTADGDSEGSLGGLVRMGEPDRLLWTIVSALNDAAWCSADPVCSETTSQGVRGLNGAACHACSLVAETSCVHSNQLLDRHFMLRIGDGRLDHGLIDLPQLQEA
jgi:hypothetical protein